MSKQSDGKKASDICSRCNGVGEIPKKTQRIVKDRNGNPVSETVEVWVTCPACNGFSAA